MSPIELKWRRISIYSAKTSLSDPHSSEVPSPIYISYSIDGKNATSVSLYSDCTVSHNISLNRHSAAAIVFLIIRHVVVWSGHLYHADQKLVANVFDSVDALLEILLGCERMHKVRPDCTATPLFSPSAATVGAGQGFFIVLIWLVLLSQLILLNFIVERNIRLHTLEANRANQLFSKRIYN